MSLEEEIVFQLREENEEEIVKATCEDLVSESYFELNNKKINIALKKYNLLQKYKNKSKNGRGTKKRIKEKIERLTRIKIQDIINQNPNVLLVKKSMDYTRNGIMSSYCSNCNPERLKSRNAKIIGIDSIKDVTLFLYCKKCGEIRE